MTQSEGKVRFDTVVLLDGPEAGEHLVPEHLRERCYSPGRLQVRIDDPSDDRFELRYAHVQGNTFRFTERVPGRRFWES